MNNLFWPHEFNHRITFQKNKFQFLPQKIIVLVLAPSMRTDVTITFPSQGTGNDRRNDDKAERCSCRRIVDRCSAENGFVETVLDTECHITVGWNLARDTKSNAAHVIQRIKSILIKRNMEPTTSSWRELGIPHLYCSRTMND
jgi:hypothetical protein